MPGQTGRIWTAVEARIEGSPNRPERPVETLASVEMPTAARNASDTKTDTAARAATRAR